MQGLQQLSAYASFINTTATPWVLRLVMVGLGLSLTVADFKLLSDLGLFNGANLEAAISQFRQFERASLRYAELEAAQEAPSKVGLWEQAAS